ncbi:MAG TPA: hypothetical protein VH796_17115 [Nitrososphaeraceae archaeon]|jgi:hypothetical protein
MLAHIKVVMEATQSIISKELKKQIGQILEVARQDFKRLEDNKKERLLRLAKEIKEIGYPKNMICEEICKSLAGEGISDRYIRMVLPEEYKKKKSEMNVIVDYGSTSVVADKNRIEDNSLPKEIKNVLIPDLMHQKTNPTVDTDLKTSHNDQIQKVQQEHIDQEKEELKNEVEDLKKCVQQLKQELSGLKDRTNVGPGQQKVKIPANEIIKVLINRAMKMGAKYFELLVENGIAKLPRTKV